jgi:predicted Zn-dependent protease
MNRLLLVVGAALLMGSVPVASRAQTGQPLPPEVRTRVGQLLQEATRQRSRGDYAGARANLEEALAADPASIGGVLLLEAVLTAQGDVQALLPYARALLETGQHIQLGYQVLLRTLSADNRADAMASEAERWLSAAPDDAATYREIARIWERHGDMERALAVLQRGRKRLGRTDALALELGVAYARLGEVRRAVEELDRALGPSAGTLLVVRRWLGQVEESRPVADALVAVLLEGSTTRERRNAAFEIAVDAGLEARARTAALGMIDGAPEAERTRFLSEAARRAGAASLPELEYWAYRQLLEGRPTAGRALAIRNRLAELALAMGDTARARADYLAIEREASEGSPQRRRAAAFAIELAASSGEADAARAALAEFHAAYPDAREYDRLAGAVAGALLAGGDAEGALAAAADADGPRANMVRGRALLALGRAAEARDALMAAVADLSGLEATRAIALLSLLDRLDGEGASLLAEAVQALDGGRARAAVELLVAGAGKLEGEDAAALLDFAASIAERASLPAEAEAARRRLVERFPDAPESAAALLALAETLGQRPEGRLEARVLLERLILEHPRSALLPRARRLLDRLEDGSANT